MKALPILLTLLTLSSSAQAATENRTSGRLDETPIIQIYNDEGDYLHRGSGRLRQFTPPPCDDLDRNCGPDREWPGS